MTDQERIARLEEQVAALHADKVAIAAAVLAMTQALQSPMGGHAVREVLDEMRDVVPEMFQSHFTPLTSSSDD